MKKAINPKLIRITTVPVSLKGLLKRQHRFMSSHFEVIGVSSVGEAIRRINYAFIKKYKH